MQKTRIKRLVFFLTACLAVAVGLTSCNLPSSEVNGATKTAQSARETLYSDLFPNLPASSTTPLPSNTPRLETSPMITFTIPASAPTGQFDLTPGPGMLVYYSQSGDTLEVIARHYGVEPEQVVSSLSVPSNTLLTPRTLILVPDVIEEETPFNQPALPDSEVIYGPGSDTFDLLTYAEHTGGFINEYSEIIDKVTYSGPEIVHMVALETSTNPRLLLAFLEFRSNWVLGSPPGAENDPYPIGFNSSDKWLYDELMITARLLAEGYYGWRVGALTELTPTDGGKFRIHPELNAGTVAMQRLFTALYKHAYWEDALYGEEGFLAFYEQMLGDPWARAESVEPLFTSDVEQPELALPFLPGLRWSFTAGPHGTWQTGTPRGALDFAPVTGEPPCAVSAAWTTAAAPGLVVRSMRGTLALDLDGDGDEGTGWVLVYMHVAEAERAAVGSQLTLDGLVGHPSCERGNATGTHVHFTRKYNGEWLAAEEPLPMIMDGWQAFAGEGTYEGTLVRGYQVVVSSSYGKSGSSIYRDDY